MNAAFLLVATAFIAGSDPVQAAPAPVATQIVSNGSGCGCDTCNTCNTCEGKHWFGGFRGLFAKNDCGCDSCGKKRLFSGLGSGCGCGGGFSFSLGLKDRFSHKCDTCNDCGQEKSCGCGIMESPLSRLGGLFKRKSHGCDSCNSCSTCGSSGAIIQGAPPVAPVPAQPGIKAVPAAPQKMPAPPAKPVTSQLTPTSGLIIE